MIQDHDSRPVTAFYRRSGLDRRWIPSKNHQPERRTVRNRSVSESPGLAVVPENRELFPEIPPPTKEPPEKHPALLIDEKAFRGFPGTVSKEEPDDDR